MKYLKCFECSIESSKVRLGNSGIPLCSSCERSGKQSLNESKMVDPCSSIAPIVNELLTYTLFHFNICSYDEIKQTVLDFYTPDEIKEAKELFWSSQSEKLPLFESRRDSASRSAQEANIIDLLNAIKKIDNEEAQLPQFSAVNLSRLPKNTPRDLDSMTKSEQLSEIEHRCESAEKRSIRNTDRINDLFNMYNEVQDNILQLRRSIANEIQLMKKEQRIDTLGVPDKQVLNPSSKPINTRPPEKVVSENSWVKVVKANGKKGSKKMLGNTDQRNLESTKFTVSNPGTSDNAENSQISNASDFEIPREQRKRKARANRKAVFGRNSTGTLKGAPRRVDMFVFHLEKETDIDLVQTYVEDKNVNVFKAECVSHEDSVYKSFRITVDFSDRERMLEEDFWPQGVGCRQFFRRRQKVAATVNVEKQLNNQNGDF